MDTRKEEHVAEARVCPHPFGRELRVLYDGRLLWSELFKNGLSKFNPIRWGISLLPSYLLGVLIDRVIEAYHQLTGGRAAPGMRAVDAESADIEQVVRRVLSNALSEPYAGAQAH